MASPPTSIAEAGDWLRKRFRPEAAEALEVTYAMALEGTGGGELAVRVSDGRCEVREQPGCQVGADVVFRMAAGDFFDILSGAANPDLLFMEERLLVEGDLSLALKLRTLFRPGD